MEARKDIGRGTGIAPECVQEVLESGRNAGAVGQGQFETPVEFARFCARPLPTQRRIIADFCGGHGQFLVGAMNETTELFLANDIESVKTIQHNGIASTLRINGDICRLFPLLKEVSFEHDLTVCNPPFSVHWKREALAKLAESDLETVRLAFGQKDNLSGSNGIDSTAATIMMALDTMTHRGEGVIICNNSTADRLIFSDNAPHRMLAPHFWGKVVYFANPMSGEKFQTWDKEKPFETAVLYFAQSHADGLDKEAVFEAQTLTEFETAVDKLRMGRHRFRSGSEIIAKYNQCQSTEETWRAVRAEFEIREGKRRPEYNIYLDSEGRIQTYLSIFDGRSVKIPKHEAVSLFSLNGKMAMELVMMRSSRQLLLKHVHAGIWRVHPDLSRQVDAAVKAYHAARAPLFPLNPIQSLGYIDESETLECKIDMRADAVERLESPAEKIVKDIRKLGLRLSWKKSKSQYVRSELNELKVGPAKNIPKELEQAIRESKNEIIDFLESESQNKGFDGVLFRAGKSYPVQTQTVTVSRMGTAIAMDGSEHQIFKKGQELAIWVTDETGVHRLFLDRRHAALDVNVIGEVENEGAGGQTYKTEEEMHPDFDLQTIAKHFIIPTCPDVAICQPEQYQANLKVLDSMERMIGAGFACKPFQRRDLSRAALHDGLIMGWQPGTGKTLAGILWPLMKVGLHPDAKGALLPAKPVLIVAPASLHFQMKEDYRSLFGAAMPEVIDLDCQETFLKLSPLKPGWYISSFQAISGNKVKEFPTIPGEEEEIDDAALASLMKFFGITVAQAVAFKAYAPAERDVFGTKQEGRLLSVHDRALLLCKKQHAEWSEGIDTENAQGIKCVYSPSLADYVRHQFECVVIDEAVRIKAEDSIIGIGVRSLDPKYRLVLTGTPIKNRLPDIFFLSAWACDALHAANARWPYHGNKAGEIERFAEEFQVMARDLTKERKEAEARGARYVPPEDDRRRKQRKGKATAEVCNVHRLWKLLAPVVLRRLKKDIGEDIVPKVKRPIYVPMGTEQAKVYAYHLQASYLDKNGMPAIGAQLQALRNCAAAPHTDLLEDKGNHCPPGIEHLWKSTKDFIPKLHACLEVVEEVLRRREQCVIFSPFHEPLDTISKYLKQAGVGHDVLDGRMSASARGKLAMRFKQGLPTANPVLLAGMRACSEGNSWDKANNVILYSFDWALDLFLQAIDRVHRLNSKKPVNIYPIICRGSIDRKLESLLDEKDDSTELVLDGQLMTEQVEEISLHQLLKIAHAEFSADKSMPESDCEAQWPAMRERLMQANTALLQQTPVQVAQQEAQAVVVETLLAPVRQIMEASGEPKWMNWSRRFRFT